MSSQYPRDEFDRAGEDMPVGMHRPKPSKWKNVWPFLVILVIVPALGWVAATALYRQQATNVSVQPVPATSSSAQAPATRGRHRALQRRVPLLQSNPPPRRVPRPPLPPLNRIMVP